MDGSEAQLQLEYLAHQITAGSVGFDSNRTDQSPIKQRDIMCLFKKSKQRVMQEVRSEGGGVTRCLPVCP